MDFITALIALIILMAMGVWGYWFARKDAISMYPRRKKPPADHESPDEK